MPFEAWCGVALLAGAYLLGSYSLGLTLAARAGIELRAVGSGNIGATNVGRALGRRAGRLVMLADAAKGAIPVLVARFWLGEPVWIGAAGVAAAMGHVWPIYYRFRGGKGAATAAGAMLAAVPLAGLGAVVVFFVTKKLSRRASVGSLAGAATGAALVVLLSGDGWTRAMAAMLVLLVLVRHRDNITRIARGTEPRDDAPAPHADGGGLRGR